MAAPRTRMGRKKMKRPKPKKRAPKILSILFLAFIAIVAYSFYEYKVYNMAADGNSIPDASANSDNEEEDTTEEEFKGQKDEFGKVNVLLLGVDSHTTNKARTDTIMIAQYDPKNGTAKLASIMRDTYVEIPGYSNNKINSAFYNGGPELLRNTVKENFGIDVQYYALVNFDGFTEVVDVMAPDGVEIDVEKRMRYTDNAGGLRIHLDPGVQTLNGEELLGYARFRNDSESDFGRVRRQQQVIGAVKGELISVSGVLKVPRMLGTIEPYIETNMKSTDIAALVKDFLLNPANEIDTLRIPVDGSYRLARYDHAGSVIAFDEEENKQALQDFFNSAPEKKTVKKDSNTKS